MRPVTKTDWPLINSSPKSYNPHTIAKTDLESNLGFYCSYCEVFSSDLEVEHVVSQNHSRELSHDWNNFLLACGRCNGRDNKSNKPVNTAIIHFPHMNNTFISFVYKEGGYVMVNPALTGSSLSYASNLLNLVCLDKIPGNVKYPNLNQNDTRWKHRRTTWEWAEKLLPKYVAGNLTAQEVVDFAIQRGFFSVWYSVFTAHSTVKQLLITNFTGTTATCFDPANNYYPLQRNPANIIDPI